MNYEESYINFLKWLTPRELVNEYVRNLMPWRKKEREFVIKEIEMRCII